MSFYILVSFSLFSLAFFFKRRSFWVEFLAFLAIFVITAFRYEIGCDWFGYEVHYFSRLGLGFSDIPVIEPLYWSLVSLIDVAVLPYQALQVAVSLIFFASLFWFSRQFNRPLLILAFAFPLFIFGLPMTALRQALAASFVMPSFVCLIKRRFVFSAFLILLASQFHISALSLLFLPVILFFGINFRSFLLSAPLIVFGWLSLAQGEAFQILSYRYSLDENQAAGALYRSLLYMPFGLILLYKVLPKLAIIPEFFRPSGAVNFFKIISIVLVLLAPLSLLAPTVVDRYSYYFAVLFGVIMNYDNDSSSSARASELRIIWLMSYVFLFFVAWFASSVQLNLCYVPYRSILF